MTGTIRWVALLVLAAGCSSRPGQGGRDGGRGGPGADQAARAVPVVATTASKRDVPIYLEGLGNVTGLMTVTVKPQVDGRLEQVQFREGQAVHKGDVLATIDPRPFLNQLHQAEGQLARDTAQLRDAKLNLQRYEDLVQRKLVPAQQVDDQRAAVGNFEGAIQVDQAAIDAAKLNLDYAQIKSPLDGITGVRLVDPGNIVHASDPNGIVVITQLDPVAVLFTLPEDDLPSISTQMNKGQLAVDVFDREGKVRLGSGLLALIDNQINQATATIRLKAILPNPQRMLWPNQFVKARLLLEVHKGALVVPAPVIQRGPQGTFAYVVGPDDTVQPRNVEIETTAGDWVLISKGLEPGERVVVDGQNQLRPGAKVNVRMAEGGIHTQATEP